MTTQERRGLPIGAIIVIAIGVLFLLQNLGVLPWSLWTQAWRLWPVVLIVIGINILIGRRYPLVAAALILLVVGGSLAWLAANAQGMGGNRALEFANPRDTVQALNAKVDFGASSVRVTALPTASEQLWQGRFEVSSGADMDVDFSRAGDGATLAVRPESGHMSFLGGKNDWTLRFARDVAVALTVNGGAGDLDLDLRDLRLTSLDMNIGASNANIRLPSVPGVVKVDVDGGASNVEIHIPDDVAARIRSDGGLTSISVAPRFKKSGDVYLSDGYDAAERKVDITLSTGAASVTIR